MTHMLKASLVLAVLSASRAAAAPTASVNDFDVIIAKVKDMIDSNAKQAGLVHEKVTLLKLCGMCCACLRSAGARVCGA